MNLDFLSKIPRGVVVVVVVVGDVKWLVEAAEKGRWSQASWWGCWLLVGRAQALTYLAKLRGLR